MTDRQTKFTLRSLERGLLMLTPIIAVYGDRVDNIENTLIMGCL